jgi:hypothetical protein
MHEMALFSWNSSSAQCALIPKCTQAKKKPQECSNSRVMTSRQEMQMIQSRNSSVYPADMPTHWDPVTFGSARTRQFH